MLIDLCTSLGPLAVDEDAPIMSPRREASTGASYLSYLALNRSTPSETVTPSASSAAATVRPDRVARREASVTAESSGASTPAHPSRTSTPVPSRPVRIQVTKRPSPRLYFAHFIDHREQFIHFLEAVALKRWGQRVDADEGPSPVAASPIEPDPNADPEAEKRDQIAVWNTATGTQIRGFSGHRGTPRSISWDPNGNGNILCSGGRDGAIHLYDLRIPGLQNEEDEGKGSAPIASIWGAHTTEPIRPLKGRGSRGGKRGINGRSTFPKGITSLTYVPGRGNNILCSAGCGDGIVKLWDLRAMASYDDINMRDQMEEDLVTINDPLEAGLDVSLQFTKNKSPHGISSIVASSTKIFASCTDGCIYTLPLYDLKARSITDLGLPIGPMFDPAQRGNSLYARLALHDDERTLALGCTSGAVSVWDTHAASKAAAELSSLGVHLADLQPNGTKRQSSSLSPASEDPDFGFQTSLYGQGQEELIEMARPSILHGAHRSNYEINGVSWAHGPNGPTLASISDDHTIRTWSASQN